MRVEADPMEEFKDQVDAASANVSAVAVEDDSAAGRLVDDQGAGARQYTMPGILHYLQHEWSRFEDERSEWDVEKAELKVKIELVQNDWIFYFVVLCSNRHV